MDDEPRTRSISTASWGLWLLVLFVAGGATTYVLIGAAIGVGTFALVSWMRHLPAVGVARSGARLGAAHAVLASLIVPWLVSNPSAGDPTDVPWHAAWHLLSALFVATYWW